MPGSNFDAMSPKAGWLVWLLNWPILGLGNVYARGASSWRWLIAGVALQMVINWTHAGFGAWLSCYVLLSVLGMRDVQANNQLEKKNRKLQSRYDQPRENLHEGSASQYASERFERKLRKAEQALQQQGGQAVRKGALESTAPAGDRVSREKAPRTAPSLNAAKAQAAAAPMVAPLASDLTDYVAQLSPLDTTQSPAGERAGEGTQGDYGYAFFTSPLTEFSDLGKLPDFYKFASADDTVLQEYVRCPGCGSKLEVGEAYCATCRPQEQL